MDRSDTKISSRSRKNSLVRRGSPSPTNRQQKNGDKDKDNPDACTVVNKQLFKSIYAQGIQLKFVKLLFLHLKHSIRKYIVTKEATKKQQNAQKNKTE